MVQLYGDEYYPSVGALVWVSTASAAPHWAGRVTGAPTLELGLWLVSREGYQRAAGADGEWVHWQLLAPRRAASTAAAAAAAAVAAPSRPAAAATATLPAAPPPAARPVRAAAAVEVLPPTVPLPAPEGGFSIASFNMLLNEWFSEKYYRHDTPPAAREWPARAALMQGLLKQMSPDILCIQEGNGKTFEGDFGFMLV